MLKYKIKSNYYSNSTDVYFNSEEELQRGIKLQEQEIEKKLKSKNIIGIKKKDHNIRECHRSRDISSMGYKEYIKRWEKWTNNARTKVSKYQKRNKENSKTGKCKLYP